DDVSGSLQDADIFLPKLDITQDPRKYFEDTYFKSVYSKAIGSNTPFIFVLNKLDLVKNDTVDDLVRKWKKQIEFSFKEIEEQPRVIPISALKGINLEILFGMIIESLPESEPYFPKDQLTDRPEKYFIAEIIREKIFVNFREEIPYATEVVVDTFKEEKNITRIRAEIYVERKSQKPILIGKQGSALKKIGTRARLDIEMFLGQKVFLELFVKVKENWRNNPSQLKSFGY
ncbi:MAG: GTPase Era, partial [Bacteroidetes bacterium]|nr:GTPase Era [Bacteroidota bacterium]